MTWSEVVVVYLGCYLRFFHEETWGNYTKPSVRIDSRRSGNRSRDLQNMKQECYPIYRNVLW